MSTLQTLPRDYDLSYKINVKNLEPIDIKPSTFLSFFNKPLIEWLSHSNKNKIRIVLSPEEKNLTRLLKLNSDAEKGVNIYFTPNGQLWNTNPIQRKDALCDSYDWIVFDTDTEDSDEASNKLIDFIYNISLNYSIDDILPSFIVKTKRGYHIYYKLSEPLKAADSDIYAEVYNNIITAHLKEYPKRNAIIDPSTKNIGRLFRLPGAMYRKWDVEDHCMTNLIYLNQSAEPIDIRAFNRELINYINIHNMKEKVMDKHQIVTDGMIEEVKIMTKKDQLDEEINRLPILAVVTRLGYKVVQGTIYNPKTNKPTDWWKVYTQKNIVHDFSNKWARPGGTCIQFIMMHFKGDLYKAYSFVEKKFGIQCSSVLWQATPEVYISFDGEEWEESKADNPTFWPNKIKDAKEIKLFVWGLGTLTMKPNKFCITYMPEKWVEQVATNFYVNLLGKAVFQGKLKVLVQLISRQHKGRTMILPTDSTVWAFNKVIRDEWMFDVHIWSSKFINLLHLFVYQYISSLPELYVVNNIKYIEKTGVFVAGEEALDEKWEVHTIDRETWLVSDCIVELWNLQEDITKTGKTTNSKPSHLWYNIVQSWLKKYTAENFNNLIEDLKTLYDIKTIIGLFLWITQSIFSDFFYENWINLPHIIVWWESRAGKTEIISLIKKLLSFKDLWWLGTSSITMFPFFTAAGTGIPVHLTEWVNNGRISDELQVIAKDSFDGREIKRWTTNQTVNTYRLKSNIIFDGEEIPNQDALQTRSLVFFFKKSYKKEVSWYFPEFISKLVKKHTWLLAYVVSSMREYALDYKKYIKLLSKCREDFINRIKDSQEYQQQHINIIDLDRMLDNYVKTYVTYVICAWGEHNKNVLGYMCKLLLSNYTSNKAFESWLTHFWNFISPIIALCMKAWPKLRWVVYLTGTHKLTINTLLLKGMVSWPESWINKFESAVTFLSQHWYIENQWGMATVDFKNNKDKLRPLIPQWRQALLSMYAADVLKSKNYEDDFEAVEQILEYN